MKRTQIFQHCQQRLQERYGITISHEEFNALNRGIRNEHGQKITKVHLFSKSKRLKVWALLVRNKWVVAYYDRHRKTIVTFPDIGWFKEAGVLEKMEAADVG